LIHCANFVSSDSETMLSSILASMPLVLLTGCENYDVTPTSRSLPPQANWTNWHSTQPSRPGKAQVCPNGSWVIRIEFAGKVRGVQKWNTEIYITGGVCSDGSRLQSGATFGDYGCMERHEIKGSFESDGSPDLTVSRDMRLRYLGFGNNRPVGFGGYGTYGTKTLSCGSGKLIAGWQIQTGCAVDAMRVYCTKAPPSMPSPTPALPPSPSGKFCPKSPQQLCRMMCPPPSCAPGECAMRQGSCCDLKCVKDNRWFGHIAGR